MWKDGRNWRIKLVCVNMIKAEKGLGVNVQCKQNTKGGRDGQIPSLTDRSSSAQIFLTLQHEKAVTHNFHETVY